MLMQLKRSIMLLLHAGPRVDRPYWSAQGGSGGMSYEKRNSNENRE